MKKITQQIIIGLIMIYIFIIIVWSKEISSYVLKTIELCINTIIPSLYIFMIVSDFLITSNIYCILGKPFSFISKYIFKIPEQMFSIFLISSVGGYPVGAKLISTMLKSKKIDVYMAANMIPYCYFSGPAFIIGIAGINIFSDIKAGILIFISIMISNLIIAIIIGQKNSIPQTNKKTYDLDISVNNFIKSISEGGKSIFNICAIIVFFSSIICVLEKTGIIFVFAQTLDECSNLNYSNSIALIKSLIEISNICLFEPSKQNIPVIAALLSFGGICILLQIRNIVRDIPLKEFIFFRVTSMFLAYYICKLLCFMFYDNYLSANSYIRVAHSQNSPIPTLFLLIMTILFLLKFSIEKTRKI